MPPSGSCCHLPVSSAWPHFRLPFSCRKKYSWYSSLLGTEYYYTIIKSANDRTVTDLNKTNINLLLNPYKIPTIFWEQIQGCWKTRSAVYVDSEPPRGLPGAPRGCRPLMDYLSISTLLNVIGPWDKTKYCYSWCFQIVLSQAKYRHGAGNNLLHGMITKVSWLKPDQVCCVRSVIDSLHYLPSSNIIAANFDPQISHEPHPRTYIDSVPCYKITQEGYLMPLHNFSHSGTTRDPEETPWHTVWMQPACSTTSTELVITRA